MISIALFTSPSWKRGLPLIKSTLKVFRFKRLCAATTAFIYVQLILGALMRHTNSGLAIPDFPLAFGRIIPPFTSDKIVIHFAHRVGAMLVAVMVVWTFSRIARSYSESASCSVQPWRC